MDAQTRNSFYVKDAAIDWALNDAKKDGDADYVKGKKDMAEHLQAVVEREFKTSPSGSEAAHFRIKVTAYARAGTLAGNLIGMANDMFADVDVVRDSDGKVLGTYQKVHGFYAAGGGVLGAMVQSVTKPDVAQLLAVSFAKDLRKKFDAS